MRNNIHGIALSNRYKLINEWVIVVMVKPEEMIYHSCNPLTLFSYLLTIPPGRLRWFPESTPPSRDLPPLNCDSVRCIRLPESPLPPRISTPPFQHLYATLPESTHPSQNIPLFNNYMWPSQSLPLTLRIYPPSQQLYATLPESTPPSQNIPPPPFNNYNIMLWPSQNIPLPPRIYPLLNQFICATLP